jgi:GldM C-terminal domain
VKSIYSILFFILCFVSAAGQKFSIAADKMNVLYADVDNPITLAVENYPNRSIVVKTNNGKISRSNGSYMFFTTQIGTADIILYKKTNGKLKEIGRSSFRVKLIPYPVAKVGPSAGGRVQGIILKSQQYIRAQYEYIDIDIKTPIDSFTVNIIPSDTCFFKQIKNYTNKFSQELTEALAGIKKDYVVIFRDISAKRYNGEIIELDPIYFIIRD